MTDMEKVISVLERCMSNKCAGCPKLNSKGACTDWDMAEVPKETLEDALTLLKAQRARVMTLEEVKASKGADMYLEISTRPGGVPYITAATLDGVGIKGLTFYHSSFDFVTYNRRYYGWRCWTSRPTDELREAVKWNETQ